MRINVLVILMEYGQTTVLVPRRWETVLPFRVQPLYCNVEDLCVYKRYIPAENIKEKTFIALKKRNRRIMVKKTYQVNDLSI